MTKSAEITCGEWERGTEGLISRLGHVVKLQMMSIRTKILQKAVKRWESEIGVIPSFSYRVKRCPLKFMDKAPVLSMI